jgi:hypothetical protein
VHDWERAVANFLRYLPQSVERWVVALEPPAHERIAQNLTPRLPSAEVVVLDDMSPAGIRDLVDAQGTRPDVGFLEFSVNTGQLWDNERREAMTELAAGWPRDRVKRCFDVWDANFTALFAEDPVEVSQRCYALRDAVTAHPLLEYHNPRNLTSRLSFGCAGAAWTAYTGFEAFDHILPSGEVSCLPRSVTGRLEVQGWIVGTIPFGLKYGYVRRGDLALAFDGGQVTAVTGRNRPLCADLDKAFAKLAGLCSVGELGIGQSTAVAGAAMLHEAAYHWHERHFGIHLGLGVELPEANDPERGGTAHHLDIVLATGALIAGSDVLAEW